MFETASNPEDFMSEQELMVAEFEKQADLLKQITTNEEGLQEFLNGLSPEQVEALTGSHIEKGDSCIGCVDEGLKLRDDQQQTLRIAGSGILLGQERATQLWKAASLTTITAHESCGAAALYCQQSNIQTDNPSHYVAEILKGWAIEAGLNFEYEAKLDRPDFHSARAVIIDLSNSLRPNDVPTMPKSFVVTANGTASEAASDALLSAQIAFGEHGFGDLFTPDSPLVIAVVGADQVQSLVQPILEQIKADPLYIANQQRITLQIATMPETSSLTMAAD
jgi:hypothetical protein